jgi:hypothetical protein
MNRAPTSRFGYALVSVLVLIPCFWQKRIQAGDLSSHIYNSWLAQLVERGKAPGLFLATQSSNVLFDLILSKLFNLLGAGAAQRIAVPLAVLIFFWGAFALISEATGSRPWSMTPCLALLAYGWVFQSGFFNFYLSLGLCFIVLALCWTPSVRRVALAAPLLGLAYWAHGLPFTWAVALLAYMTIARRLSDRHRLFLLALGVAAICAARLLIVGRYVTLWSAQQPYELTGIDQLWICNAKYYVLSILLAMFWCFVLLRLAHVKGSSVFGEMTFHLFALTAAIVLLIPSRIDLPGYHAPFSFIAERMSLAAAICFCALLASAKPERWQIGGMTTVALVYFSFLYVDTAAVNRFEDRMEQAVATLPPDSRVFTAFYDPGARVLFTLHLVDRACIGRCFSYGNYEATSWAFRLRTDRANSIVLANGADLMSMQLGGYKVKPEDTPLYQLYPCSTGGIDVCARSLQPGEVTTDMQVSLTPQLW